MGVFTRQIGLPVGLYGLRVVSSTVAEGPVDPNWSQQNLRPSTGRDLIRDDSTGGWARRTPVAAWPDSSTEMAAALRELHQRQCGEDCRVNSVDQELLIVPDENLGAWVIEQTGLPMMRWLGNCHARVELLQDSLPEWKFMRLNTLEGMRVCMKRLSPRIESSGESLECARLPIERMRTIAARKSEI